jgi:hypothetical protein
MRQTIHALFDNDALAHEVLDQMKGEGLVDSDCGHRCTYDRLDHSPNLFDTNVLFWAVGGAVVMAHVGAVVGAVLGVIGFMNMSVAASTMLGMLGMGSIGGLACTLAGAGSQRPDLVKAGQGLHEGRLILSFAVPESRLLDAARRRLLELGALQVTPGVVGTL